jgi:hypothetical protein
MPVLSAILQRLRRGRGNERADGPDDDNQTTHDWLLFLDQHRGNVALPLIACFNVIVASVDVSVQPDDREAKRRSDIICATKAMK